MTCVEVSVDACAKVSIGTSGWVSVDTSAKATIGECNGVYIGPCAWVSTNYILEHHVFIGARATENLQVYSIGVCVLFVCASDKAFFASFKSKILKKTKLFLSVSLLQKIRRYI